VVAEVLVLLHGLGGTGGVWRGVARLVDGQIHAPDLPGHGRAPWLATYSFGAMAEVVAQGLPPARSYAVIGHSLGGVVGLALAGLVPGVRRVVGLGIKVAWSDEELARAQGLAERPVAWFDTQAEAVARHRKVSGTGDLVDEAVAREGVVEDRARWRLALDPKAFGVGRPDVAALLRAAAAGGVGDALDATPAAVTLARGELDHLVSDGQLRALVDGPVSLPGLGHNAHLQDPGAVLALV
jgi:pimeloyl-ACP methyl ester carboxylesterase